MAQTGQPARRRRRGRPLTYDPASNEVWKTTARFSAANAAKIIAWRDRINDELPVDELLDCLAGLVPVDPNDPPLTAQRIEDALRKLAARFEPDHEERPLAS